MPIFVVVWIHFRTLPDTFYMGGTRRSDKLKKFLDALLVNFSAGGYRWERKER